MSDQWRIDNVATGGFYALVHPDGRCVGTLSDAESTVRVLRALNHLEALEHVVQEREARLVAAIEAQRDAEIAMVQAARPCSALHSYHQGRGEAFSSVLAALAEQPAPGATTTEGQDSSESNTNQQG